uniref:ABA receptor PYL1 n=1 Tax=Gladiolus hybrid cultivar TaxID=263601 RepID=A0A2Z4C4S3_9ASPA|nr:ABA receptor PYL1 [Gladiolus hybrid cultivar]
MDGEERGQDNNQPETPTPSSSLTSPSIPSGLTAAEYSELLPTVSSHHLYQAGPGQCSSLLAQRVKAPAAAVWSIARRFDRPQIYKHFVRSCALVKINSNHKDADDNNINVEIKPGCLREVSVISGLPASTSTERLDILDDSKMITGFTIIGGEHRLRNYRSVTTVTEFRNDDGKVWSVVLESYIVDVPEGNSEEDTRLFADTVVRLNLQKLASLAESTSPRNDNVVTK